MDNNAVRRTSLLFVLLFFTASCSAHGLTPTPITAAQSQTTRNTNSAGGTSSGLIFVTNYYQSSFRTFRLSDNGNIAPVRVIAGSRTTLVNPIGIAVAADGRVGIANYDLQGGGIHAQTFAPNAQGNVAPLTTISCGGTEGHIVWGAAFDRAGNLYITSGRHQGYDISVFAPA